MFKTGPTPRRQDGPAEDIFPPQQLVELFKISFHHPNVQKSFHWALVERRVGRSRWGLVETPIDQPGIERSLD